jgi:hypothetical protein
VVPPPLPGEGGADRDGARGEGGSRRRAEVAPPSREAAGGGSGARGGWEPVVFWGLLLTGAAIAAVPLWAVDFVPFQDLPGHLATVRAMQDMDSPGSPLHGLYFSPNWLLPNAIFFYLTSIVAAFVSIPIAAKVVLSLYCLALPASLAVLFHAFGRSRWLALFGLWYIYNDPFGYGFAAFALGLPLLFFWLAAAHRHANSPSARLGAWVAVGLWLLFLAHAQVFLTAGLFGVAMLIAAPPRLAHCWGRIWPYLLGSVPFLAWFFRFFVFPPNVGVAEVTFGGLHSALGFRWASPNQLLDGFRNDILMGLQGNADEAALLAVGGATMLLLACRREPRGSTGAQRSWMLEVLTLTAALGYVALPLHMQGQALISSRFLPIVAMLLLGWGALPKQPWLAAALLGVSFVGASAYHVGVAQAFAHYEAREMGNLRGLMALLGPDDRLAYLRPDRAHRVLDRGSSWYLDSYHMVLNGGLSRMPFHLIYPHHTVVRFDQSPPRVDEVRIQQFPRSETAGWYTHVLVFSAAQPRFGASGRNLELLGQTGCLWLYRIAHPPLAEREPPPAGGPEIEAEPRRAPQGSPPPGTGEPSPRR